MFGHVCANPAALSEEENRRYRAAYCGLCRCLGEKHGQLSRLSLSYDLTFLVLLLSSLYEPEERSGRVNCLVHPLKKSEWMINGCTHYAADMTVALGYHKALDDWKDEGSRLKKAYASHFTETYAQMGQKWPEQCLAIERELKRLSLIEKAEGECCIDEAANCFGRLLSEIFVYKKDRWEPQLRAMGYGLGRYIYLADAAVDFENDMKSGAFNPLTYVSLDRSELRFVLKSFLGEVSEAFESLPLIQDANILRNILYSGIWMKYDEVFGPGAEKTEK